MFNNAAEQNFQMKKQVVNNNKLKAKQQLSVFVYYYLF